MRSMEGQPSYSTLDVAKHNTAGDAWIIVNGKVLDITSWLSEHPGGEDVLLDLVGRDATREFEDVGHSNEARSRLDSLVIGILRASTEEELRIPRTGTASKRKSVNSITVSHTALYDWINDNFNSIRRFGAVGVIGMVTLATAMALRRYGIRAISFSRR